MLKGQRFAFMDSFTKETPKLLGPRRKFQRYGQTGRWVSEEFPHIGRIVDDLTFTHTVKTENFNHAPAKIFTNTGSTVFGRPSMGAWVTYGIGSESEDLPGFVVLQSGPRGPRGGAAQLGRRLHPHRLPGRAVPLAAAIRSSIFRARRDSITTARARRSTAIRELNQHRLDVTGDPEISTRIAQYEMAYRMQTSGPELIDFSTESQGNAGALRRRTRRAIVRQQLPARPAAGRARRALRPALSHRLGPPRRPQRKPRHAISATSARKSTGPAPR